MYSNNKKTNVGFPLNIVETSPDVDFKYGPYASVDEALNALGENGSDCICAGLKFGVTQGDGTIKEYKFKKGIANASDLVCEEDLINQLKSIIGELSSLSTSAKSSIVAAINEVKAQGGGSSGVQIVDNLTSASATSGLSANQGKVLKGLIDSLTNSLNTLIGTGDVTSVIDSFNEIKAFLDSYSNTSNLSSILQTLESNIKAWSGQQGYLTSHQQIKTINGESLVGSGNIVIPEGENNVQADWNETDANSASFIQNKPSIPNVEDKQDKLTQSQLDAVNSGITKGKIEALESVGKENTNGGLLYSSNRSFDGFLLNGWQKENGTLASTAKGIGNKALLDRSYNASAIKFSVDFTCAADSVFFFGTKDRYDYTWLSGSLVSVDFHTGSLNIHAKCSNTITEVIKTSRFSTSYTHKHRLEIKKQNRVLRVRLYDLTEYAQLAEVSCNIVLDNGAGNTECGLLFDKPYMFCNDGSFYITNFEVATDVSASSKCYVYIVGDSLTEGDRVGNESDVWSRKVKDSLPEGAVVVSGRCGGKIDQVIEKIDSEAKLLHPKYVMVTIGTNGGNTDENLRELMDKILSIGAIPVLNHVPMTGTGTHVSINSLIDSVLSDYPTAKCIKFDVATSINNAIRSELYNSDNVHPNKYGHLLMFNQVLSDCNEIFGFGDGIDDEENIETEEHGDWVINRNWENFTSSVDYVNLYVLTYQRAISERLVGKKISKIKFYNNAACNIEVYKFVDINEPSQLGPSGITAFTGSANIVETHNIPTKIGGLCEITLNNPITIDNVNTRIGLRTDTNGGICVTANGTDYVLIYGLQGSNTMAGKVEIDTKWNTYFDFYAEAEESEVPDSDVATKKASISILSIGNSWSCDSFNYVPALLNELIQDCDVNFGILHYGGCTLERHLQFANDGSSLYTFYNWNNKLSKWEENANVNFAYPFSNKSWDVVVLQQQSGDARYYSTYQPYLNGLIDKVCSLSNKPVKIGWHLTQEYPEGYSGLNGDTPSMMFDKIISSFNQLWKDTDIDFVIPNAATIRNAQSTSLSALGNFGHMYYEGLHLQEGIPCLLQAYSSVIAICKLYGYEYKSIVGSKIVPNADWLASINGIQLHGSPTGVNAENIRLAQKIALISSKFPLGFTTNEENSILIPLNEVSHKIGYPTNTGEFVENESSATFLSNDIFAAFDDYNYQITAKSHDECGYYVGFRPYASMSANYTDGWYRGLTYGYTQTGGLNANGASISTNDIKGFLEGATHYGICIWVSDGTANVPISTLGIETVWNMINIVRL